MVNNCNDVSWHSSKIRAAKESAKSNPNCKRKYLPKLDHWVFLEMTINLKQTHEDEISNLCHGYGSHI